MKLAKKLSEWEQIKLIDEKQKSAILAYESRQGKNRLPFILSALAVFCIGFGILSLIASNWQEIPDSLKLSADILLLGLTAVGAYRFYNRGKWYFEALVIGYATLILASIGLVGQVFQLQPVGLRAYLLWSVLVLPTALFSKKPFCRWYGFRFSSFRAWIHYLTLPGSTRRSTFWKAAFPMRVF